MEIITDSHIPFLNNCGLTIGTFDGVHLGHLFLLHYLRSKLPKNIPLVVYTFTNHPTHVLSHLTPIPLIYTIEHKLKILQELGVDYTILSPFTKEVAGTPYDQFLIHLKKIVGFAYLVLGEQASFGKNKEGDKKNVHNLSKQLDFHVEYLPKFQLNDEPLSSGRIRTLIARAEFVEASRCLGRPYSIYAPLRFNKGNYHMSLCQLCLPPTGTYSVQIVMHNKTLPGYAHLERRSEHIRIETKEPHFPSYHALTEVIF